MKMGTVSKLPGSDEGLKELACKPYSAVRPWFAESVQDYARRVGLDASAAHPLWDAGLRAAWEEMKRREKAAEEASQDEAARACREMRERAEEITLVEGRGRS